MAASRRHAGTQTSPPTTPLTHGRAAGSPSGVGSPGSHMTTRTSPSSCGGPGSRTRTSCSISRSGRSGRAGVRTRTRRRKSGRGELVASGQWSCGAAVSAWDRVGDIWKALTVPVTSRVCLANWLSGPQSQGSCPEPRRVGLRSSKSRAVFMKFTLPRLASACLLDRPAGSRISLTSSLPLARPANCVNSTQR